MCGIFGWQLNRRAMSKSQVAILGAFLADSNDARGGDSWGFVDPSDGNIIKGMGKMVNHAWRFNSPYYMLGHTRKGTVGKIVVENSHPFDMGKIVGVHNGMISDHEELNKKHGRTHEVDSQHILSHIQEGKELKEIFGYGMVAYYWKDNPTSLFLSDVRDGQITVRSVGPNGQGGIVFSSSDTHLTRALDAAGIEYDRQEFAIKPGMTYEVRNYGLYNTTLPKNQLSNWSDSGKSKRITYGGSYGGSNVVYPYSLSGWNGGDWDDEPATTIVDTDGLELVKGKWHVKGNPRPIDLPKGMLHTYRASSSHEAYELDCYKFFENIVSEGQAQPEDWPMHYQWKVLSDQERAVLCGEDRSSVLPSQYEGWLNNQSFKYNKLAETWFQRWLESADFKGKAFDVGVRDTDELTKQADAELDAAIAKVETNVMTVQQDGEIRPRSEKKNEAVADKQLGL